MGFTSPRTWVASELETAAIFNVHVRDNLLALYSAIGPTSVSGMMTQYIWCTLGGTDGHRPVVGGVANEAWHLCNGDANIDGTGITAPDWRNRFIIGAGDTYAQGATGGAATYAMNHSHAAGTLATDAVALPNHVHLIAGDTGNANATNVADTGGAAIEQNHVHAVSANSNNPTTNPTHTHTISGTTASGGSATQSVLPPYHALYGFIYVGA